MYVFDNKQLFCLSRPLVQSKLDVLSRVGLTGDDFSSTDTKRHVDPRQKRMMEYFEQSFIGIDYSCL